MVLEDLYQLYLQSSGVCIDTRKIKENNLFFALKGPKFNGNTYASQAIQKGAFASIVDEWDGELPDKVYLVKNVLESLSSLAKWHRKSLNLPILAITGSNGKTTTKELCAAVLGKKFNISYTQGNLNNHIGVPLTLLTMNENTGLGIVEMGANHQREIAHLCDLTQPDFGLITNIGKAHLEGFGGIEGVKIGKGEMYESLMANKKVIFCNRQDVILEEMIGDYKKVEYYDAKLMRFMLSDVNELIVQWKGKEIVTKLTGVYNKTNIAAAITIGVYFGVEENLIREALETYLPDNNRSQITKIKERSFILDAYNANPDSMKESLSNFIKAEGNPKYLILGDMLELGKYATEEHLQIINQLSNMSFKRAYLVGEIFHSIPITDPRIQQFLTIDKLKAKVKIESLDAHSLTLLKGSRGIKIESFVE